MAAPLLRMHARRHPHGASFYAKGASGTSREGWLATRFVWTRASLASIRLFQGARGIYCIFTKTRTVCLLARRRLGNQARTSCLSGREKLRRSTTTTVQGISPVCYDARILGVRQMSSQPHLLSRAEIVLRRGYRHPQGDFF